MLRLEEIKNNATVSGIEPGVVVRVVTTEPAGADALTVYYKTPDGKLHERMLFRADEAGAVASPRRGGPGRSMRRAKTSSWRSRPTESTWRTCSIR